MTKAIGTLILFITLTSVACGPGAALQPLVGEDADVYAMLESDPESLFDDAPCLAANQLLNHLRAKRLAPAWAALSFHAQRQTISRANLKENIKGEAILAAVLGNQAIEDKNTLIVQWFGLVPSRITPYPPEAPKSIPTATAPSRKASVYAYNKEGDFRKLTFVFDEYHWKLDMPAFL